MTLAAALATIIVADPDVIRLKSVPERVVKYFSFEERYVLSEDFFFSLNSFIEFSLQFWIRVHIFV